MIRRDRLIAIIFHEIIKSIPHSGFAMSKKHLTRRIGDLEQRIELPSAKFRDRIQLRVDLQIRDWPVENFLRTAGFPTYASQITAGLEIDQLNPDMIFPKGYPLYDDSIKPYVAKIVADVTSLGLGYFDKINDRRELYYLLSKDDMFSWINNPNHVQRGLRALTMAIILGIDDESLENLINKLKNRLSITNSRDVLQFDQYVDRIIALSAEVKLLRWKSAS